jgi:hypothetical protein
MAFARIVFKITKVVTSSYTLIATGIATYLLIDDFLQAQKRKRAERKAQEARKNDAPETPESDGRSRS